VLVPHPRVGSRLLLYLGIILPIVVYCAHRRMLQYNSVSPFSDVQLRNQRLILSLKAQHPFIPFSWSAAQEGQSQLTKIQVFTNADHAYSRTFRELSLKCKLQLKTWFLHVWKIIEDRRLRCQIIVIFCQA
jgi:hypothetical protein